MSGFVGGFEDTWAGKIYNKGKDLLLGSKGEEEERRRKALLQEQAKKAGEFADYGEGGFRSLAGDADTARANMLKQATGELSYSKEALRQGLQQQLAQQRSMAMSASPMNGPMAARTAAMNMGRASSGMSGQAALAGIQEQMAGAKAYGDMTLAQRKQELEAALGSRANANTGYGANNAGKPEPSTVEKIGPAVIAAAKLFSDERAKKDIKPADDDARRKLEALQAVSYRYKNPADGRGPQFGILAQDLEKAGLKSVVTDGAHGKMVDAGKLSGANTGMLAALADRVAALEGKGKSPELDRDLKRALIKRQASR